MEQNARYYPKNEIRKLRRYAEPTAPQCSCLYGFDISCPFNAYPELPVPRYPQVIPTQTLGE